MSSAISQVDSKAAEIDSLLDSPDISTETKSTLSTLQSLMIELSSALASYLSSLPRAEGKLRKRSFLIAYHQASNPVR